MTEGDRPWAERWFGRPSSLRRFFWATHGPFVIGGVIYTGLALAFRSWLLLVILAPVYVAAAYFAAGWYKPRR